jgi:hypothetical protein
MKTKQITLEIPTINIDYSSYYRKFYMIFRRLEGITKEGLFKTSLWFKKLFRKRTEPSYSGENYRSDIGSNMRAKRFINRNKKIFGKVLAASLFVLLFIFIANMYINGTAQNASDTRMEVKDAISSVDVNREFNFPLKDADGEEVSKIKYMIEKAELTDEIITEGKRATAVKGRIFLILVLKITNQYERPIEINTRDYVRLSVNANENELLAPDTHNDPVEIQAISTKFTRVGFIINDSDKDLVLHVGEIQGDKEKIELDLRLK